MTTLAKKAKGFTHDNKNNVSVDWYTPPWIFEKLGLRFDLDPCQPETPIPWIPAAKTYSLKDDGLTAPWDGLVWCNPPYGKHTLQWLERMNNHRNGIALLFARTDCAWFHRSVAQADAILFLSGRIRFVDGLGLTSGGGAGCGSMLVAWGATSTGALRRMGRLGYYVEPFGADLI
jgi:DNA N-6-adenine-methyltransferase (Dam)